MDQTEVLEEHSSTTEYEILFSVDRNSYLNTATDIHGDDEESIEISEDVLVDDEDAGVKPQEQ